MKKLTVVISIMLVALSAVAVTKQEWEKYAADMKSVPGLIRFYSFTSEEKVQPNRCGISAEMKFSKKDMSAAVVDGRITGLKAVTLDETSFRAPTLEELEKDFTVSIWVKPVEAGSKQGNGQSNGMISSSGSGYYDGWRLAVYDTKNFIPTFQIGRGKNAISLRSSLPLSRGFWNHLVASWDGKTMKIFVNGVIAGSEEFTGPAQPAKSSLAVGYTGFGVGSLKMAVDELAVFNRALFPGEIAALSLARTELPDAASIAVNSSCSLVLDEKVAEAKEELKKVAGGDFPVQLKLWSEAASIILKSSKDKEDSDTGTLCSVFDNPDLPLYLKGALLAKILMACGEVSSGIPSSLLERLPVEMNLNEEDKFTCAVALAHSYMDENQNENAFKVFDHLISLSKKDPGRERDLGFKYAQALRKTANYADAAKQYAAIANNTAQPSYVRSIAALSLAQTYIDEKKYDEAISACKTICSSKTVLPHHKFEAAEMLKACENLKAGNAARDPEAYRTRLALLPQASVTFFVSPKGSDSNPGTIKKPFASLAKARDEIRKMKSIGSGLPIGGVTVYLRGGTYKMKEPLELTKADSGKYGAPVVYSAWKDEKPVFDGGFKVRKFRKVRDDATLNRLPQEARGKVYVADLKAQGFKDFEPQQGYGYGCKE